MHGLPDFASPFARGIGIARHLPLSRLRLYPPIDEQPLTKACDE